MRITISFIVPLLLLLANYRAAAQTSDGLTQDDSGRYSFMHMTMISDNTPKEMLYERLKSFVAEDLNASDTYIQHDDAGKSAVTTIAYIELPNSPEMHNQVVSARASIDFADGAATLKMTDFIYDGVSTGRDAPFNSPLHDMRGLPYASQSFARNALIAELQDLAARMDKAAAGIQKDEAQPKAQRSRSKK